MKKTEISYKALENQSKTNLTEILMNGYSIGNLKEQIELYPLDGHKSFYKKAFIERVTWLKGKYIFDVSFLVSYKTIICCYVTIKESLKPSNSEPIIKDVFVPLYSGGYEFNRYLYGFLVNDYSEDISATTCRHIAAYTGLNKNEYKQAFNDFWLIYETEFECYL